MVEETLQWDVTMSVRRKTAACECLDGLDIHFSCQLYHALYWRSHAEHMGGRSLQVVLELFVAIKKMEVTEEGKQKRTSL